MFGLDSVSEIGVHCLILAVQSVDSRYSAGDTLDKCWDPFQLMGDCLGFCSAGLTFALSLIIRRLYSRHFAKGNISECSRL